MEYSPKVIVESRAEFFISLTAPEIPSHLLKPSLSPNFNGISGLPPSFDPRSWPLTVNFNGWRNPPIKWKEWVDKMASLHAPTWKKAGIYEAIFSSTYEFHKHGDLVLGVAERWSPDTKSFIFPWGEATITLEDMMIAGFSVIGSPLFEPIESEESKAVIELLAQERRKLNKTQARKASHYCWLKLFMDSGSGIEHEAFLSMWLSRFVFPTSRDVICDCVFPIAVHLARGTRLALAPAVLATLYRDLSLLKEKISCLDGENSEKIVVTIWAPFQLFLVWVWERFVKLSPNPKPIKLGEPRFAQWNNVRCKTDNVRLVLDSCGESFSWQPYTNTLENWDTPKFYREKEMWVYSDSDLDEDLLSFILCVRVSELVGLEPDCIQQYLPHRVARQFGFDQDVPAFIAQSCASPEDAWSFYIRPVGNTKRLIPSRLRETHVTRQYLNWWNNLESNDQLNSNQAPHEPEKCTKLVTIALKENEKRNRKAAVGLNTAKDDDVLVSTLKTKQTSVDKGDCGECISPIISSKGSKSQPQILKRKNSSDTLFARVDRVKLSESLASCSRVKNEQIAETNNLVVPPGFPPKCDRAEAGDCTEEDNLTIAEIQKRKKQDVSNNRPCGRREKFSGNEDNSSPELHEQDNMINQDVTRNRHCNSSKNLSGAPVGHPFSISEPAKSTLKTNDASRESHSCPAAANVLPRGLDNVAWMGTVENGVDAENFHFQFQNNSSSIAGNNTPKGSEPMAENAVVKEARGSEEGVESVNKHVGAGSLTDQEMDSINDSAEAVILAVANKIEKVEKMAAALKAMRESKKLRR